MSHTIRRLSFGTDYPGLVNPLDGKVEYAEKGNYFRRQLPLRQLTDVEVDLRCSSTLSRWSLPAINVSPRLRYITVCNNSLADNRPVQDCRNKPVLGHTTRTLY